MIVVAFLATSASAQRGAAPDAFVQSIKTPQIESMIAIAPEIAMEPGLGPQIISGSVGAVGQLKVMAKEDAESVPEYFRTYQIDERWEVTHESTVYLSALGTQWLFTGGAHGNTEFSGVIWRRDGDGRGEEVAVTSLFVDGADADAPVWATVSRHLLAAWEKEWTKRVGQPLGEDDQSWRDGAVKTLTYRPDGYMVVTLLPSTLAEKSAGLTFHYPPYALGPYAMGTFAFDVPYAVFADYLTGDAKEIFGGQTVKTD